VVKLSDLFNVNLFADHLSTGMVNRQFHPRLPLAILNYSHEAQFSRTWDDVTMQCRGLIYNVDTEEVVARPFRKFFNAEELGPSKLGQAFGKNVQATDKMDGSLGIMYPDDSYAGWAIATRGSFTSDQADKGTWLLRNLYLPYWGSGPSTESTYLFEIIYPENRIVLDYGKTEQLVFLATVNTETGHVGGPDSSFGWPGPRTQIFPAYSVKMIRALPVRDNAEGYVLRNEKTGFMAKVKYEEYVRLHRIIFGMNEKRVHAHLRENRPIDELYIGVPEEFHQWINDTWMWLDGQFLSIKTIVESDYQETIEYLCTYRDNWTQKDFAELVKKKKFSGLLFSRHQGKDITDSIWKLIPADGRNKMAAEQTEDVA